MKVEHALMALERHITRRWRELPQDAGMALSYGEYDYLQTLAELGSVRLSDLALEMRVSKPTASSMVKRLQAKGLLQRNACPEDGRASLLSLSESGRTLLNRDGETYARFVGELLAGLTEPEHQQLATLLQRMVQQSQSGQR